MQHVGRYQYVASFCVCLHLCGFLRVSASREYDPCTVRTGRPSYTHATSRARSLPGSTGDASGWPPVIFSIHILLSIFLPSFLPWLDKVDKVIATQKVFTPVRMRKRLASQFLHSFSLLAPVFLSPWKNWSSLSSSSLAACFTMKDDDDLSSGRPALEEMTCLVTSVLLNMCMQTASWVAS
jgi:hypothetical protein